MEGPLLDEWNAKFGVKPPEWVHDLQDVDRRISECRLRIESLRSQLDQEYFLLDWLQVVSAKTEPNQSEAANTETSETQEHESPPEETQRAVSPAETKLDDPESNDPVKEDSIATETAPKPSNPIESLNSLEESTPITKSQDSLKTSPDSSEYYSAPQYSSQDTTEGALESEEESPSLRRRSANRVNRSDVKVARTVRQKLVKGGYYQSWSCLDIDAENRWASGSSKRVPLCRKRSLSDPALHLNFVEKSSNRGPRNLAALRAKKPAAPSPLSSPIQQHRALPQDKPLQGEEGEAQEVPPTTSESRRVDSQHMESRMLRSMEEGSSSSESSLKESSGKRQSNGVLDGFGYTLLSEEENSDAFGVLGGLTSAQVRTSQSHQLAGLSGLLLNRENTLTEGEEVSAAPQEYSPVVAPLRKKSTGSMSHRSSAYLDDDQCSTPRGDVDTTMTLTRDAVGKVLEEKKELEKESKPGKNEQLPEDYQQLPLRLSNWDLDMEATLSKFRDAPEMSMATLIDQQENDEMCALLPTPCSNPLLTDLEFDDSIEIDDALISAYTLRSDMYGSRSNSTSSIPGLFAGTTESLSSTCSSPPDLVSPTQAPQVNLRGGGRKHRDRKRMGNAELDMISVPSQNGSDSSPSHTASSQSSASPLSDGGGSSSSLPLSPLSPYHPPAPSGGTATATQPSGTDDVLSPSSRSSRHYPRCSTVVVHGEALVIRKLVVAGIVSAEKSYIDCLSVMKEYYRKPLLAVSTTSQPILSEREINTIFYRVDDLHDLHTSLHDMLEAQLDRWTVRTCVGDFFVTLCRSLKLYKDYVEMYRRSLDCLERWKQESAQLRKFIDDVHATVSVNMKDIPKVNELLRRPIERLQSYSLVLTDLCQHTPEHHSDYRVLKESLYAMSAFIASTHDPQSFRQLSGGFNRELVKESLVVELSEGIRKVRRLFLFHDVLISAKQKPSRNGMKFEAKWYLPLNELTFHPSESEAHRPVPVTSDMELSVMKNKIAELKATLSKEGGTGGRDRAQSHNDKDGSSFKRNLRVHLPVPGKSKSAEKAKKKLQEQQVSFWVASPSLPLRLYGRNGKQYVFLLHNEDERESWVASIKKMQPKAITGVYLSSFELQDLLSRQTINDLRKVEEMMVPTMDGDYLNGVLKVRVLSASDLKAKPVGLYCCLELDEYGKFDRKARTLPSNTDNVSLTTVWDQDFEIELAGAHIMKVQICSKYLIKEETYAQGKIRLPVKELKQSKRQKKDVVLVPQGTISLIIEYYSSLAAMGRKPSMLSSGVFGVPIEVVAKRERHDIPLIVQTCVDEIERRGLSEVGMYRIAGVLRDVKELREAFDSDYLKAQMIAFDADIHAVAGLLKRYFRELPDPLFTDDLYMNFVQGSALSDPEARDQCLLALLHSLPPVNFKTAVFLFKHLRKVAEKSAENKMGLNNLATLFGPNLLRAAGNSLEANLAAMDVVTPVNVLLFFLNCSEDQFDDSRYRDSPDLPDTFSIREARKESVSSAGGGGGGGRRESNSNRKRAAIYDDQDSGNPHQNIDTPPPPGGVGGRRRSSRRASDNRRTSVRSAKESAI